MKVYEQTNRSKADSPYEKFESSLIDHSSQVKESNTDYDNDDDDNGDDDRSKFLPNFSKKLEEQLPGTFGTPRTSISPKQVWWFL